MDNKVLLLQCSQKYLLYKKTTKQRYLQLLFQLLLNQFSRFCHGDVYKIKTPVNNLDVLRVSSEGSDIRTFLSRNVYENYESFYLNMKKKKVSPSSLKTFWGLLYLVCCTPPREPGRFWWSRRPSITRTRTRPRLSLPSGRSRCPLQTQSLWKRGQGDDKTDVIRMETRGQLLFSHGQVGLDSFSPLIN